MVMRNHRRKRKSHRWVVKVGSNMVCQGGALLMRAWMQQVARLRRLGIEVIWVSSGAIASAVDRTSYRDSKRSLDDKQALSAIGQPILMDLYNLSLQAVGLMGAQILLTYDDMRNTERRDNLQNTLNRLLLWGVVPILNENDAVSTDEIKFGDNDSLSAKVACMVSAERLVILTDVDGLHEENPSQNPQSKVIHHLSEISQSLLRKVERTAGSSHGTGGMYSKLVAAREATRGGVETWLVRGDLNDVLCLVAKDRTVGTRIAVRK